MNYWKFIALFIIGLVLSLTCVPAVNNSVVLNNTVLSVNDSNNDSIFNNTLNNTNSSNNTNIIDPSIVSMSLPCEWTTFDVPKGITNFMDFKVGFMDKPQYTNPV